MFTFTALPLPLRRKLMLWSDTVQLAILRRVIRLNRLANKTRAWVEPMKGYLWLPLAALLIGLVSEHLAR